MKKPLLTFFSFLTFYLGSAITLFAQCPMCKAAVESQEGKGAEALQEGLNFGILYLFILPYFCFALVALFAWRYIRKAKAADRAASHAG